MISITTSKPKMLLPSVDGEAVLSTHIFSTDRSYYRSKIFNNTIGINPLIAAASPLFSLAAFISESKSPIDSDSLYQDLQHEIKAFENNAKTHSYRSDTILLTRFLLCTFLDDLIVHSAWGQSSDWQTHSLLMFFHQSHDGSERFFMILERLSQDPALHIDLLELIYLCLRGGYLGHYRQFPEGKEMIAHITQRLFDCIRFQRGELKKALHIAPLEESRPPVARLYLPVWLILSFTFAVLLTIYSSFSYMLGNHAEAIYQQINSLIH